MRVVWTRVRIPLGPLLLTFKYQFYGIIYYCSDDYQYIVTDSPHDILRPKLDTYYSGTYYCGQELLFDEDVIAWLHQCRRNWILSEIKRMRVHLRKSRIRIYKE